MWLPENKERRIRASRDTREKNAEILAGKSNKRVDKSKIFAELSKIKQGLFLSPEMPHTEICKDTRSKRKRNLNQENSENVVDDVNVDNDDNNNNELNKKLKTDENNNENDSNNNIVVNNEVNVDEEEELDIV